MAADSRPAGRLATAPSGLPFKGRAGVGGSVDAVAFPARPTRACPDDAVDHREDWEGTLSWARESGRGQWRRRARTRSMGMAVAVPIRDETGVAWKREL